MKKLISFIAILLIIASTSNLFAQKEKMDIMYLTNGIIHRGKITDKTDTKVTIQTAQGTYTIPTTSIEKIIQAGENTSEESKLKAAEQKNDYNTVNATKTLSQTTNFNNFQSQTIPYRNPGIATLMSLVFPGGGQFYNAQSSKGIGFFLWGILSDGLFVYMSINKNENSANGKGIAAVSALVCWIVGMVDANSTAKKINNGYINMVSFDLGENKTLSFNPDFKSITLPTESNFLSYGLNIKLNF